MTLEPRTSSIAVLVPLLAMLVSCAAIGASEITVVARNDSLEPMVVQVVDGVDQASAQPFGQAHTIPPGDWQELTLDVPGGQWTVTVNGAHLLSTSDTGPRRGVLPVTLVLPPEGHVVDGPYWEAPGDWAQVGP
jgi:hypothetical protein